MDAWVVLVVLALICAFTALGFGIRIANELRRRGIQANPLFVRWMIYRYMAVYRKVTLEETGEVGPLYRACSTAAVLAVAFGMTGILMRLL